MTLTEEEIQHYSSVLANISNALNLSIWENEKYFNLTVDESSTSQILSRKDLEHVVKACKLALNQNSKWVLTKDNYPIADQLGYDWEGGRSELVLCEDKHGSTYVARYYGSRLGHGTWECRSGEIITDVIIKWRELPID